MRKLENGMFVDGNAVNEKDKLMDRKIDRSVSPIERCLKSNSSLISLTYSQKKKK